MRSSNYRPRWYQRIVLRLAATRWGSALLARILRPLDRAVLAWTGGTRTLTELVTGLRVIELTTRGARSGLPRTCPLIAVPVEAGYAVIASNFGARRHPSWYYNLRANPDVVVSLNGRSQPYRARLIEDAGEKELYWRQAAALYPGYEAYRARAEGRTIPVFRLEIVEE